MGSDNSVLVLGDKRWIFSIKAILILFAIWLTAVVAFTVIFLSAIFTGDFHWGLLLEKLAGRLGKVDWLRAFISHFDVVATLGVAFGFAWYQNRARKLERFTLSPEGIQYISPLPPILKRLKPDWSLAWQQVNKAELGAMVNRLHNPEVVFLTFISASDKRRIFPAHWVNPENFSQPIFRFRPSLKTQARDEILKSVMASEIVSYISRNVPQISINASLSQAEVYTSLEKNPHGRIAIGIVFLLMIYAVIDFVAGPESYIDDPTDLKHIYILAGIIGATLSAIWLYKSTLVIGEKAGLAMLIGLLVSVAMMPGALRINAITDKNGLSTYDYFITQNKDGVVLRPVVDGMPIIDYFASNIFWKRFDKDDIYPVQIRKGGLGFYQFNSSVIVDDIHRHQKAE